MPRLRKLPLETAIIQRFRRRESSVEEALMEMYLAGVMDLCSRKIVGWSMSDHLQWQPPATPAPPFPMT